MSDIIELLQWPAMAASLLAAWLVGSRAAARRFAGFWVFLISNGCGSAGAGKTQPGP